MDVLISAARDVTSVCKLQLASFLQMSTDNFVKLFDVMVSSQGVQKYLTRYILK